MVVSVNFMVFVLCCFAIDVNFDLSCIYPSILTWSSRENFMNQYLGLLAYLT